MNFFNQKKAFMGLSLSQLVGIILVILIFIPFTGLFARTFNTFFGGGKPSIENFDSLTEKVQELLLSPDRIAIETNYPYFIKDNDYVIVAFDHEWHGGGTDKTEDTTPYGPFEANLCHDEGIRRPLECLEKSCMCIYEDTAGDDFMEGGDPSPIKCVPFGNNIFFSGAEGYPDYLKDKDGVNDGYKKEFIKTKINFNKNLTELDYEFFVIYGECWNSGCKVYENNDCKDEFDEFDARNLYIEKYYDLDSHKTHILIAVQEGNINERANDAQKLIEELRKAEQMIVVSPISGMQVTGPPTISNETIKRILDDAGSPAALAYQAFYDLGVQYGIDPVYALAFFRQESTYGTASGWAGNSANCPPNSSKNIGNIKYTQSCKDNYGGTNCKGFCHYPTWKKGIEAWYSLIRNSNHYVAGGKDTIAEILPVYAPSTDNNNVPEYISAVSDSLIYYRGLEPNRELTLTTIDKNKVSCTGQCKLTQEAYLKLIEANNPAKESGRELHVYSSYRSLQQQIDIWESSNHPLSERGTYICNPYPEDTAPTRCPHLTGGAVDLRFKDKSFDSMSASDWQQLEDVMYQAGWVRYENEVWHFEYNTNRWARADTNNDGFPNQPSLV